MIGEERRVNKRQMKVTLRLWLQLSQIKLPRMCVCVCLTITNIYLPSITLDLILSRTWRYNLNIGSGWHISPCSPTSLSKIHLSPVSSYSALAETLHPCFLCNIVSKLLYILLGKNYLICAVKVMGHLTIFTCVLFVVDQTITWLYRKYIDNTYNYI